KARTPLALIAAVVGIAVVNSPGPAPAGERVGNAVLPGRIVALGIPGASALSPVGRFLPGGPIHDNPAFAAFTPPRRVLDPARVLVGSPATFGAPVATPGQMPGAFLPIDPAGAGPLVIPPDFAAAGGQASAPAGASRCSARRAPPSSTPSITRRRRRPGS